MKNLYIWYSTMEMAWFVCRDAGPLRDRITGPWASEAVAQLSLEVQS